MPRTHIRRCGPISPQSRAMGEQRDEDCQGIVGNIGAKKDPDREGEDEE